MRLRLYSTQVLIKDPLQYIVVPLDRLAMIERNTRLYKDVVKELLGNHSCSCQVNLAQVIKVHYERMSSVNFKGLIRPRGVWVLALLHFHHLHHHAHRAGLLSHHYRRCFLQSLRQSDFRNSGLEFVLEPEAEPAHVFFRKPTRL